MTRRSPSLCAARPANDDRPDSGCAWDWIDHAEDLAWISAVQAMLGGLATLAIAGVLFR